jgi:hypothetical protein
MTNLEILREHIKDETVDQLDACTLEGLMSLQRFFGVRTANGMFCGVIWSAGELKDNKYLPVISAQEVVDAVEGGVVDIAVRFIRLPGPMSKTEALQHVARLEMFKAWKTEIESEIERLEGAVRIGTDHDRKPRLQDRQLLPVDQLRPIVDQLMQAELVDFNRNMRNDIPDAPGLYAFYRRNDDVCLHAGKTRTQTLRHRIWAQHFTQGGQGAGSDLIQKVQDHNLADSREAAKTWIIEHCRVKWIVVQDEALRSQAEEYMLCELKPIWDKQRRSSRWP